MNEPGMKKRGNNAVNVVYDGIYSRVALQRTTFTTRFSVRMQCTIVTTYFFPTPWEYVITRLDCTVMSINIIVYLYKWIWGGMGRWMNWQWKRRGHQYIIVALTYYCNNNLSIDHLQAAIQTKLTSRKRSDAKVKVNLIHSASHKEHVWEASTWVRFTERK